MKSMAQVLGAIGHDWLHVIQLAAMQVSIIATIWRGADFCDNVNICSTLAWLIMYADDVALITETREQMQEDLNTLERAFTDWGLQMHLDKTEIMWMGPSEVPDRSPQPCHVRGQAIQEVKQFKYLGSICSSDLSLTPEISNRVCKAGHAFFKLKRLRLSLIPM